MKTKLAALSSTLFELGCNNNKDAGEIIMQWKKLRIVLPFKTVE